MLAGEKGNLEDVRAALGRDLEIGDIVDYTPSNPTFAELVPDASPRWHLIETHPNQERTAAAHLVARRFGVFIPEIEEDVVRRGRKYHQTRLMFTGYIFVFVWDIMRHSSRIKAIPGVARIMLSRMETRPAVVVDGQEKYPAVFDDVPAIISDRKIDEIRAVENSKRPLLLTSDEEVTGKRKKKGRRWSKLQKTAAEKERERDNEIIACRAWSPFQDSLLTLDAGGRNQTLLNALSLP